jgi:hypothetical protein
LAKIVNAYAGHCRSFAASASSAAMPRCYNPFVQSQAQSLGYVRIWREGNVYRYVPADNPAPENAVLGERLRTADEEVIYIDRGAAGEFIRGAVKG